MKMGKLGRLLEESDTNLVHFLAKDNIVFHTIIFPVFYPVRWIYIPKNVPANEFLNLEGKNEYFS